MESKREDRSFLMPRDPSVDRRFRPCPQKRERLFAEIEEENYDESDSDSVNESEYSDTRSVGSTESSIDVESGALVYLRLKPVGLPSSAYSVSGEGKVLITGPPTDYSSSSKNKNSIEKHYSFTEIFDSGVSQREVYEKCIEQKILAEESFTVLTYGTSGSGKTFTLLGDDIRPGIIPRSLENIFTLYQCNIHPNPLAKLINARTIFLDDELVEKESLLRRQILYKCKNLESNYLQLQQSIRSEHDFVPVPSDDVSVFIWATFIEIYNEFVYDLLAPSKLSGSVKPLANANRRNLKVVCNDGNVFIKDVTSIYIKSSLDALKLLRSGLQNVTYASTSINVNSSRSHCIFILDVLKYYSNGVYAETSYKFCDLAGSERLDKTGNMGSRLKEAQSINTSLMVLGRCLNAANSVISSGSTTSLYKKERIPFRDSKLTMLLQAALQGKEKMAMIVNVTPTEKYYEENLNVLNFASIARNIIFKVPSEKRNQSRYSVLSMKADNNYIQQLLEENANLKADVKEREEHIDDVLNENYQLKEEMEQLKQQHALELIKQEQELRIQLVDSFKLTYDDHEKQFELRLQRQLENQKRIYESKIKFLNRKHEEDLEYLRDGYESVEEDDIEVKGEDKEIKNDDDDVLFVETDDYENVEKEDENKENVQEN